ncbi:prolyl-tRNA synthetase associated domain-containing protein [uncultured Limosilactobacillus sp.]|uniref:prolyl-tRNA synthetase associated domain-containing protein n=1 Tax=uncultured Limosilactobacillus sp. TaxID=2837629 RepID=UPI0025EC1791|nr:prolyl-tRNA synthetase associated domain-containing protein [uncultured Limosilactobacillus sp.]
MNPQEILTMLDHQQINYQVVNHPAVYTAAEADQYTADYHFARAKNLFLHDKHHLYLVMMRDDQRLEMKKLRRQLAAGRLSFASEQQLTAILGVTTGAVSPFNLLNDAQHQVKVVVDQGLFAESSLIGCHPNTNTQTVILKISDLLALIKQWGNPVVQLSLSR